MSRCFPFSIPSSSFEALIKAQKEKKEERKALRRREKDAMKKTKKHNSDKVEKRHRNVITDTKASKLIKATSGVPESSEKSGVTEEFKHGEKRKRRGDSVESKRTELGFVPCLDLRTETDDAKKAGSSVNGSKMSMYSMLIESWVPRDLSPPELVGCDGEDDWLFGSSREKQQREPNLKRQRSGHDELSCSRRGTTELWPRAKYLSEVDLYALPFAVSF